MEQKKIGIVILATNSYFVLGVNFIKRFSHPYKVVDLRETAHRRFDDLILEITKTPTA